MARSFLLRGLAVIAVVVSLMTASLAAPSAKPIGAACPESADACAKAMLQDGCCHTQPPAIPLLAVSVEVRSAASRLLAVTACYAHSHAGDASLALILHQGQSFAAALCLPPSGRTVPLSVLLI